MKTIKKMYEHLYWSNQRIFETLQKIEVDQQTVNRLFSHILHAEQVWLTRLLEEDSSQLPIWSNADLGAITNLIKENEENYKDYIEHLEVSKLDTVVTYKNSKGTEFQTSIRDILTHVALHGQYHRGQINLQLRVDGMEPVNIDFITYVK